ADRFRHLLADANPAGLPALRATIHPVNAAMVLLIENVRRHWMEPHTMRVLAVFGIFFGPACGQTASIERLPISAPVHAFEHAAARHPDVHMIRIARIYNDRVHLRSIRRAVLLAAGPRLTHRMIVKSGDRFPGVPTVFRAEQTLRRCASVPDLRLARVARREPENVIHHASLLPFGTLRQRARLTTLLPPLSQTSHTT